jgi:hypothetical protein
MTYDIPACARSSPQRAATAPYGVWCVVCDYIGVVSVYMLYMVYICVLLCIVVSIIVSIIVIHEHMNIPPAVQGPHTVSVSYVYAYLV